MQARIIAVIIILAIITGGFFYIKNKDDQIKDLAEAKAKLEIALESANKTIKDSKISTKITDKISLDLVKETTDTVIKHDSIIDRTNQAIRKIELNKPTLTIELSLASRIEAEEIKNTETSVVIINALWDSYCEAAESQCKQNNLKE